MSKQNKKISLQKIGHLFRSSYLIQSLGIQHSIVYKPKLKNQQTVQTDKQDLQFSGLLKGMRIRQVQLGLKKQKIFQRIKGQFSSKKIVTRVSEKKKFIAKKTSNSKSKMTKNKGLTIFYRNQIISLIELLNRKQDYLNLLKGKYIESRPPLKNQQIQQILTKKVLEKGKDKGRQKFSNLTIQQLKYIRYKPKTTLTATKRQIKIKQQDIYEEEQQEDSNGEQQELDLRQWKKNNSVGVNQKVFIVKGGYHDLRKTFIQKGWYQNQNVWSNHYDFKWTTKTIDIDFNNLKNGQCVNHFNNNHHLTSKYGITRRLKSLILNHQIDIDKFYPRCYDLGDQIDFSNFVENFKQTYVQSIARDYICNPQKYQKQQLKIKTVIKILQRKLLSFNQIINIINHRQYPIISIQDWLILTDKVDKIYLEQINKNNNQNIDSSTYKIKLQTILNKIQINNPQYKINGKKNIWIVKPNFLSRGRGIKCFDNIYNIADYCLGKQVQFVIQKYIQNPLLILSKKFDIRQWVLIQDYNPPIIWFYQQCYLRFCTDDYSLDNISNKFMHLTNNSIQKYNKKIIIDQSMWTMKQFIDFIGIHQWTIIQEKIKNIVVWSIRSCQGYVTGRKGSYQLVGYDFMIDQNLNPWLIEINMSPSMDYSTPVTKRLVKKVLEDTAQIISSNKQKNTGQYSCIYKGNEDSSNFDVYKF